MTLTSFLESSAEQTEQAESKPHGMNKEAKPSRIQMLNNREYICIKMCINILAETSEKEQKRALN